MATASHNTQSAPYPAELAALVASAQYRPGWRITLDDLDRGQGSAGLTLVITTRGYDSYHPDRGEHYRVNHYFPVPPAAYNRRSWQHWLFQQLLLVEQHECMEFFQVDGVRPYAPAHGPGNDPYLLLDYGHDVDKRTKYTGELNPELSAWVGNRSHRKKHQNSHAGTWPVRHWTRW